MSNSDFSDAEIAAIGGCVKDKDLKAAKASLADGSNQTVDVTLRITGSVNKGVGTPGAAYSVPASVSLESLAHFCQLLRILGIGAKRLRSALEQIAVRVEDDPEFAELFAEAAQAKAAKLPPNEGTTPPTIGRVTTNLTFSRVA